MKKLLIGVVLIVLTACNQPSETNRDASYIGLWAGVKRPENTIKITPNGGAYILAESYRVNGKMQTKEYAAVLNNGSIGVNNGVGVTEFRIDPSTGHLKQGSREWKKK